MSRQVNIYQTKAEDAERDKSLVEKKNEEIQEKLDQILNSNTVLQKLYNS